MTGREEHLDEQLSRYLDDDLGDEERGALEERLSADPELSARLESLRRLRAAVASLAERDRPPAALDRLVAPRSLARASSRTRRRWLHAVAAAATVAIAVGVGIQIAHKGPGGSDSPAFAPDSPPAPTPFQLAPLPEGDDDRELSATSRLARTPPEEPPLDDPPALEPGGPYDAPPTGSEDEPTDRADGTADVVQTSPAKGVTVDEAESAPTEPTLEVAAADEGPGPSRAASSAPEAGGDPSEQTGRRKQRSQSALAAPRGAPVSVAVWVPEVELRFTDAKTVETVAVDVRITAPPDEGAGLASTVAAEVTVDATGTITAVRAESAPSEAVAALLEALQGHRLRGDAVPLGTHAVRLTPLVYKPELRALEKAP